MNSNLSTFLYHFWIYSLLVLKYLQFSYTQTLASCWPSSLPWCRSLHPVATPPRQYSEIFPPGCRQLDLCPLALQAVASWMPHCATHLFRSQSLDSSPFEANLRHHIRLWVLCAHRVVGSKDLTKNSYFTELLKRKFIWRFLEIWRNGFYL